MKILMALIPWFILTLSGCAHYNLTHTTTTTDYVGTQVVEVCELSIVSTREIKGGDIAVDKHCAVAGGAEKLGVNEKMLELMSETVTLMSDAVEKVP